MESITFNDMTSIRVCLHKPTKRSSGVFLKILNYFEVKRSIIKYNREVEQLMWNILREQILRIKTS